MFIAYAGILATNIIMTIVAVPVVGLFPSVTGSNKNRFKSYPLLLSRCNIYMATKLYYA